ncbi:MAG: aldehyde ferredoxin oxidoreductase family protein [Proteobacteria bacterium]|nr:aldehyde ferredoxin oxidoreductase family protein [Pseudomonadota bacterium]
MNCEAGYAKRLLQIELTDGNIETLPLDDHLLKTCLGGAGLATQLFLERFSPDVDPLSKDNPLMVMTGPLTGTTLPGSSRFAVCARSPLTGFWGVGTCGGNFGPELKYAGYDGILIQGKSEKPVYILINDESIEIRDASDVWGKDIYAVTDMLKERHGGKKKPKVLAIGPAGENQVLFAAICNDSAHFIGRTGLGAVMGSKNLKAIVVTGSGKVLPAMAESYKELRSRVIEKCKESMVAESLRSMGTASALDIGMVTGDVPIRNWRQGEFEGSGDTGGPAMTANYLVKEHACYSCPIACKRVVKVDSGPYKTKEGPGPEYETCCTFGSFIENNNLEGIIKANELCNKFGVDTISCGSTIAFAMECFEKGLLSTADTDGLELTWGNIDVALKLIEKISLREGIGHMLAQGSVKAARQIGNGAENYAVAVKGLELPAHDPRGFHGMGLEYAVGYRGACHLQHMTLYVEQGMSTFESAGLESDYDGQSDDGKAKMALLSQNLGVPAGSSCLCLFVFACIDAQDAADMIRTVTGWDFTMEDFLNLGSRLWLLQRGMTNLMGAKASDDTLPANVMKPLDNGMAEGSTIDLEKMLTAYYELRGIDTNGIPRKDVLEKAGLNKLAARLHG